MEEMLQIDFVPDVWNSESVEYMEFNLFIDDPGEGYLAVRGTEHRAQSTEHNLHLFNLTGRL